MGVFLCLGRNHLHLYLHIKDKRESVLTRNVLAAVSEDVDLEDTRSDYEKYVDANRKEVREMMKAIMREVSRALLERHCLCVPQTNIKYGHPINVHTHMLTPNI